MLWVVLAVLTAVSESLKDLFSKRSVDGVDPYVVSWALRFFALFLVGPVLLLEGIPALGDDFWWSLVVDAVLNVLAAILYTHALQRGDLSATVPIITFTPLFLLATSPLIVGEFPTVIGGAGIVLIVVGSYLLNVRERSHGALAPLRALLHEPAARMMLGVAFIYSITSNIDKIGVQSSSPVFWSFAVSLLMTLMLTPVAFRRARASTVPLRPRFSTLALAGVFAGLVVIFQMTAIELTLVAYVVAVKRTSTIMSVLLGHFVLGEEGLRERLSGAIVMVLGVVLITLG